MPKLSRMGRTKFRYASHEQAAIKLAAEFSKVFKTYIDPYDLHIFSALGYWSHNHQDVQKFTGHYNSGEIRFDYGSWELTPSDVATRKFKLIDNRGNRNSYSDFEITA